MDAQITVHALDVVVGRCLAVSLAPWQVEGTGRHALPLPSASCEVEAGVPRLRARGVWPTSARARIPLSLHRHPSKFSIGLSSLRTAERLVDASTDAQSCILAAKGAFGGDSSIMRGRRNWPGGTSAPESASDRAFSGTSARSREGGGAEAASAASKC